jgi:hypothetical protein
VGSRIINRATKIAVTNFFLCYNEHIERQEVLAKTKTKVVVDEYDDPKTGLPISFECTGSLHLLERRKAAHCQTDYKNSVFV